MDETTRPQTPAEQRYLKASRASSRRWLRNMSWRFALFPLSALVLLFMRADWTWQRLPFVLTPLLLAAIPLVPFLATLPFRIDIRRLDAALAGGMARDLRIRASAVVVFEGTRIKPEKPPAFAFQTGPDEILFINHKMIETSALFPNTDFSIVSLADGLVAPALVIAKHGTRLEPLRMLPPDAFRRPPHLARAKGRLEDLEAILDSWPQDRVS